MTVRHARPLRGLLAGALALGLAGPALATGGNDAQGSKSDDASAAESASAQRVTDAQLEKFADAYGGIRSVQQEYAPKIRGAEDKSERTRLKKEGQQEMVAAIRGAGLEISEYQQLGQRLNGNRALQKRLQQIMQEQRAAGDGDTAGSGQ